jgi:preprotein translocase subunit SecF
VSLRGAVAAFRGQRAFHVDIIGRRRMWLGLAGGLVALAVVTMLVRGLNFGIDFRGGALLAFPNEAGVSVEEIRDTLAAEGHPNAVVQLTGENEVRVRTESLGPDRTEVLEALAEQAGIEPSDISVEDVGPKWGEQISAKALQGLVVFLVLVAIYITFRFEWKMALAMLVTLVHDLTVTAGFYALLGREVTPETVIAILTILGYSLYDTVVIFDKIKENAESAALVSRETYSGMVNLSLNQVLMRSVNTSLSTLLPIGALLLFGGETLESFAFALFVGVGVSTYSSVFVAAPLFAVLKEREPKMVEIRQRAERREQARPALRAVPAQQAAAVEEERELAPVAARPSGSRPASAAARRKPKKKPRSKRKRR